MITISSKSFAERPILHKTLLALGALVIVAAAFWPALHGGFIFDDYPIFAENNAIHVDGWHWHSWVKVWQWSRTNIQRPLAMVTYAFNYAMGGSTFGFKLTNLVIHLVNMLLVMLLAQRLLQVAWPAQDSRRRWFASLGIAAIWAIHPLQVSTVMYVVQRMEMLAFSFVLLALLAYWRARHMQMAHRRAWPWLLLALTLAGAGFAFKETAALTPGYAMLMELTLLHFRAGSPRSERLWRLFYAAGALAAVAAIVFYVLPHYVFSGYFAGRDFTAWQRELTQLRVLPMYLGWMLLPLSNHLTFYYDNYAASTSLLQPATTLLGGLVLLALLALACATYRRRPLLAFGIGWFFVAHVLTSAPLPLELVFEHRNYPALLGVVLALADVAYALGQKTNPRAILTIAGAFALTLAFLTVLRASVWGSPFRLAFELTHTNPGSLRAAQDLARSLMAMSGGDATSRYYGMSIAELERAARLPDDSPMPEEALLTEASTHPGMPTQPWWDSLRHKLETRPLIPDTFAVLHRLTEQRLAGNTGIDAEQLAACYAIATAKAPWREALHADYAELAGAILRNPALAGEQWILALKLDPDVSSYGKRLTEYLVENHRYQEAAAVIAALMELRPPLHGDPKLNDWLEKTRGPVNAAQVPPATRSQ